MIGARIVMSGAAIVLGVSLYNLATRYRLPDKELESAGEFAMPCREPLSRSFSE